ncbi:protein boule-like isoform X2 [Gigantopelta aegis]|uniref:protein boule-like isoform X2 n=1 Tax=Gigantopelta aegis TaxID=1735272 RepID=UPI001B88C622|nr:protein boule-like isoform X2 [Gigantopelta aegis]
MSSADVSPSATPSDNTLSGTHAPKYGTVIPNRIFVGGIAANVNSATTEAELKQFFSAYGAVKDTKIIADRAGVSKGYGFVTFENQEDAERIIKKESDNLVFKDRKLNIGPAIRKQVLPRSFDPNISQGGVMFTNGTPYTYQNGMAIFHSPEGGYPIPQPQQATPQWTTAAANQWRWATQSPGQPAFGGSPGYIYATVPTPEVMYAQPPPHAYQPADMSDASLVEGGTVEGNVIPVEQSLANRMHVSDANSYSCEQPPVISINTPPNTTSTVANLKKHVAITRRSYSSPTILVKHGHKVQRVMVANKSPTNVYGLQEGGDYHDGVIKAPHLNTQSNMFN